MIDIEFDLSDVKRACDEAHHALVSHLHVAVTSAATEGVAEAKTRRRYKDRTGGLTGSAYARITRWSSNGADAVMGWTAKYATFVDGGTAPHVIEAKRGGYLRFAGAGGDVFVRRVNHPGTRPDGFAGLAYQKAESVAVREIEVAAHMAEAAFNKR
jgi:hypothetical protein